MYTILRSNHFEKKHTFILRDLYSLIYWWRKKEQTELLIDHHRKKVVIKKTGPAAILITCPSVVVFRFLWTCYDTFLTEQEPGVNRTHTAFSINPLGITCSLIVHKKTYFQIVQKIIFEKVEKVFLIKSLHLTLYIWSGSLRVYTTNFNNAWHKKYFYKFYN